MRREIDTSLFVGGPADGQRKAILYGRTAVVIPDDGGRPHEYVRQTIAGERAAFTLWVHRDTTIDDALQALFDGYAPAKTTADPRRREDSPDHA